MTMDSSDGQSARIFVGNVAPDTDPDLIEQQFKVKNWEENVFIPSKWIVPYLDLMCKNTQK